jgi:hypothetical protein
MAQHLTAQEILFTALYYETQTARIKKPFLLITKHLPLQRAWAVKENKGLFLRA